MYQITRSGHSSFSSLPCRVSGMPYAQHANYVVCGTPHVHYHLGLITGVHAINDRHQPSPICQFGSNYLNQQSSEEDGAELALQGSSCIPTLCRVFLHSRSLPRNLRRCSGLFVHRLKYYSHQSTYFSDDPVSHTELLRIWTL